jgi:VanZ family protein
MPVLLYCAAIFVQSSFPSVKETYVLPHGDKLLHVTGYALLGALLLRAFMNSALECSPAFMGLLSVLLTGLYGATDEFHQHFVSHRTADVWDFFFDLLGGFIGVYLYRILSDRYPGMRRI